MIKVQSDGMIVFLDRRHQRRGGRGRSYQGGGVKSQAMAWRGNILAIKKKWAVDPVFISWVNNES